MLKRFTPLTTCLSLILLLGCDPGSEILEPNGNTGNQIGQPDSASQSSSGPYGGDAGVNTTGGCIDTTTMESQMLTAINNARASARQCGSQSFAATLAVSWDERLERAALNHSTDMASNNFFSHTGSDGSNLQMRVDAQSYLWTRLSENIAAGQTSIQEVVNAWLNSPGHCANIMDPNVSHVGASCADDAGSDFDRYWTQIFAEPAS